MSGSKLPSTVQGLARARSFTLVGPETGTQELPVLEGVSSALLGRGESCDVVINEASVSREHARLYFSPELAVEDYGSRNGTRVAGRLIAPRTRISIAPSSLVELGDVFLLVHEHADGTPMRATASSPVGSPRGASSPPRPPTEAMARAERLAELAAKSAISVILTGETGVGKEVFAGRIHRHSTRHGEPFVAINCGALAESLLESELFGHERGAFTGAHAAKVGLLESAGRGTVFLDELGEMPASTQVKLLRALETREVTPVGGRTGRRFEARVLSATHRDLDAMCEAGTFRRDLFYRLNGLTIEIPPLRDRPSEIVPLAEQFARAAGGQRALLTADAAAELQRYDWPGNVRELRNVVERACLFAEQGPIERAHIEFPVPKPRAPVSPSASLRSGPASELLGSDGERQRIVDALAAANGSQKRAAELLGLTRRAMQHRLDVYKISGPRKTRA